MICLAESRHGCQSLLLSRPVCVYCCLSEKSVLKELCRIFQMTVFIKLKFLPFLDQFNIRIVFQLLIQGFGDPEFFYIIGIFDPNDPCFSRLVQSSGCKSCLNSFSVICFYTWNFPCAGAMEATAFLAVAAKSI